MSTQSTASGHAAIEKMDHSKYVRSSRSRRRTIKIIILSVALALMTLVLIVVGIYSSVKINTLHEYNRQLEIALSEKDEKLSALQPLLDKASADLDELVAGRFPNLASLAPNQMVEVKHPYVKSILFTITNYGNRDHYKYLLVAENNTTQKFKPSYRVMLFDEHGVHIATDELRDENYLAPGESRDYASEIEFFFDAIPRHFHVDDAAAEIAASK